MNGVSMDVQARRLLDGSRAVPRQYGHFRHPFINMKILWVKPGKLLPLDSGGKLRTFNILRHLSASHDLTYLSYYSGERDREYDSALQEMFPGAVPVHAAGRGSASKHVDYLRRLAHRAPYAISRFAHPAAAALVTRWFEQRRFDVAVCDFLVSALIFPSRLDTPTLLFQHNVESMLWERRAAVGGRWTDRLIARLEYEKMRRFEAAQLKRFHYVAAVSEHDRHAMLRMNATTPIGVVPTGVDLTQFRYDPTSRPAGPVVVFTGSMDWAPNIDGVEYFCAEVWPEVLKRRPDARFQVVGRDPSPRVRRLASASVDVTGTVPSVIDHVRGAAVFVVPLRVGGGTRLKIYEGMALGKATVSTTIGAEGLDVTHDRDIVIADAPGDFADAVVRFLNDDTHRRAFEAAAATTAQRYDWSAIAPRFVDVLQTTIDAAAMPRTMPVVRSQPAPTAMRS
jgi:glycosyltransferase involved in cell wall biosynthesis